MIVGTALFNGRGRTRFADWVFAGLICYDITVSLAVSGPGRFLFLSRGSGCAGAALNIQARHVSRSYTGFHHHRISRRRKIDASQPASQRP
ncbi:hypothetical protein AGR5A_Lc70329 [Agrobacterium genomosp. 5 str. CFBP 6626]|nr:hypothetical protein AGR5A_Lc70329 [Agrobacterium genomosp. 5 str. CFBP 6626]